ncbi:MAG: response regulator [Deltaproteobacteria bacterium]|nr:response regulator [Deltaproteobacteria bacterium]
MNALAVRGRILVADDELGFRDLFRFTLEPLGYEIVAVADGLEALEQLQKRTFELVVLDVHMPRMGGPEALARIRAVRPRQRVIILSSSSDASRAFEDQAAAFGASACLFKPVELEELIGAIERAVAESGGSP